MIPLLYKVHRWTGIALAVFMVIWLVSGLAIIYGHPLPTSRAEQLAHADPLQTEPGWLGLQQAWSQGGNGSPLFEGRLTRIGGQPVWLVETAAREHAAVSALNGAPLRFSPDQAEQIARTWTGAPDAVHYVETQEAVTSLRNYQGFKPFHRVAVNGLAGTQLLISARTGEVLEASNRFERGLFLVGNWIHLFRPLDAVGAGDYRRVVLTWVGATALIASTTGLVIGWLRWRPRWGNKPPYPQGRTQPYREKWLRWHFWSGLTAGLLSIGWTLSGYLANNPFQLFSQAAPSPAEVSRYVGTASAPALTEWSPTATASGVVELVWRRLGDQAVLTALRADGQRQELIGQSFSLNSLTAAAQRLADKTPLAGVTALNNYDSYYYPNSHQSRADKPLPVLRADLADAANTSLYLNPQDGSLLLKLDDSRRRYRWLFSALHFWDFGWLSARPLWDGWMLGWIGIALLLSVSSVVIGWRRLKRSLRFPAPQLEPVPDSPGAAE